MTGGIAELVEALKEKQEALECLQSILEEEYGLITGLDSEGLQVNTSKKLELFDRISKLNDRCRVALENACRETGVAGGKTLSPLLAGLKQPEKEIVQRLQKTLFRSAEKTDQMIKMNKGLLEISLGLVENSINFFRRFFSTSDTYGQAGRMMAAPSAPRIVCKEM